MSVVSEDFDVDMGLSGMDTNRSKVRMSVKGPRLAGRSVGSKHSPAGARQGPPPATSQSVQHGIASDNVQMTQKRRTEEKGTRRYGAHSAVWGVERASRSLLSRLFG